MLQRINNWLRQLQAAIGTGTALKDLGELPSATLKRGVRVRLLLPPGYYSSQAAYPALYLNDGQDLEALNLRATLHELYRRGRIAPLIVVAVHAGDRMQEYGTAGRADYKGRGSKAAAYTRFLTQELMPYLEQHYRLKRERTGRTLAGFSLGGLSAFDIAWHQPKLFAQVGVFSGSLWWRAKAFRAAAPDANLIVQSYVRQGPKRSGLRFWLQAGTDDEQADRNQNGVIDAIDDTLSLIRALKGLGYREGQDIHYVEVTGGQHNPLTWGRVMPDFLKWAFPPETTKK